MSWRQTPGLDRTLALALAGALVVSACSGLTALDLAVVPATPRERVDPSPPPAATPAARATPIGTGAGQARATAAPTLRPAKADQASKASERRKPRVKTVRLKPRPAAGPFRMDLYRKGDFVHQATKDWCVAGSTQIMMNIIDDGRANRSVAFQGRLYERGRQLSPNKRKLGPIGVDLIGWAELLNSNGYGPYVVDGAATRKGAIRKAARALRLTDRPVGLVVWRGAHSWVMSGFTASADPAFRDDFKVTQVYVQDTWYPSVSTIWGASRPPGSLVPVPALAEDYLPYARPRARHPKRDGRFMLILPVLPPNTVAR